MDAQFWLVGLSNTIHLLATVVWIGWSAMVALVIAPEVIEAHRADGGWITVAARRLPPLAYGALAALGATGMIQMGAHPQYEGMFSLGNLWSGLLFAKHFLILVSVGLIFYLGGSVSPRLRLEVRRATLRNEPVHPALARRFRLLAWFNLMAGIGVLALTGLMTAIR